jgi:hypothetical protein
MGDNNIISKLQEPVIKSCDIDNNLFERWDVKRGLRNADGTGVLVGLTNIGDVVGYNKENGRVVPIPGKLFYRGIDLEDIVAGFRERTVMALMRLSFCFSRDICLQSRSWMSFQPTWAV